MLVPTGEHPPSGVPLPAGTTRRRRALNRAVWRWGATHAAARWVTSEQAFRDFRAAHGLPTEAGYGIYGRLSPSGNVALVSPSYYPPPDDFPPDYTMAGFTTWVAPSGHDLPAEVLRYLEAGDAPVLVTLGSSAAAAAPERFAAAARALDALGLRGLFLVSTDANVATLRNRAGVWPFVPLAPLLPHCRAVVHSGAHGTNATVLTAGLPSVVAPQLFDQVWHADRVAALGVGVHVRRARQRDLVDALARVTGDPAMRAAASAFAGRLASEDGPRRAADVIEAHLE
jgi:UDP:flavonoid glycosyltransferase YjiC (YdhE family)